jgi:polar amino acid transport system substrate-binding protein/glutamate/aspartate transport system substrate-binding protein
MPVMDELGDRGWRHADPEFVVLDLLWNADEHDWPPKAPGTDLSRLSQENRPGDTRSESAARGFGLHRASVISAPDKAGGPVKPQRLQGEERMSSIRRRLGVLAFAAAAVAWPLGSADAGTLDRVKQDKTFRIAFRDDAAPFSFTGSIGEPAGFTVDLCRSVAKHVGEQLNIPDLKVSYVLVTAANRFDAITTGKADLLCEPTSETLSRRAQVDFSIPTFIDGASLLVASEGPSDFGGLSGKKVGVLAGTTTEQSLRDTLRSANIATEVMPAKTHEEGLAMLDKGEVVAYFGDRAILSYLASKSSDSSKLRLANNYFSLEPYALALARGDEDFRLAVDRALSHIYRSGEIAAVFAHTFGEQMQPSDTLKTLYVISALPD